MSDVHDSRTAPSPAELRSRVEDGLARRVTDLTPPPMPYERKRTVPQWLNALARDRRQLDDQLSVLRITPDQFDEHVSTTAYAYVQHRYSAAVFNWEAVRVAWIKIADLFREGDTARPDASDLFAATSEAIEALQAPALEKYAMHMDTSYLRERNEPVREAKQRLTNELRQELLPLMQRLNALAKTAVDEGHSRIKLRHGPLVYLTAIQLELRRWQIVVLRERFREGDLDSTQPDELPDALAVDRAIGIYASRASCDRAHRLMTARRATLRDVVDALPSEQRERLFGRVRQVSERQMAQFDDELGAFRDADQSTFPDLAERPTGMPGPSERYKEHGFGTVSGGPDRWFAP